ncbi:MAG TPA: hypothetical protein VJA82_02085 [Sediminibacterium sp.]|uniref:DUF5666 domain-containing protein n=1 Tax=Candidatus Staskawiczbacteria bacterium RIFOXYD1_FULL_32_13 TaxID=1802234 RepID=A0A1G2JLS6_9BACT|nr:hypothetical protein [Sediminibacterium sp.]KKP30940.1 MAG: hypothetical protein UR22_C0034G0002 [Parcubacteria group bacterium GW2011_GWC2_32_10]OGZ77500.1 MAG: hypothetical protein A2256_01520 [Candidatus Staskawiczbacteria bacterium RIFOXYA2_FULL_32_7]OGZ88069.1 MAG: hypothetical protein A2561_05505 [Candidatus Staskawiczbacteria bacterium RIFOXYD1_FULL_32_13]HLD52070.1 hypothetical protein [Sediminibacterium sp.]
MERKNLTIIIVVAVVAVIIGLALGMNLSPKSAVSKEQSNKFETAVKSLSSKVIPSIIAYGQVTKIENKNITLTYNNETLTIPLTQSTSIYTFVAPETGSKTTAPTQKKAAFSEIKVGDSLNITIKLLPDGTIEGQSVIILIKAK